MTDLKTASYVLNFYYANITFCIKNIETSNNSVRVCWSQDRLAKLKLRITGVNCLIEPDIYCSEISEDPTTRFVLLFFLASQSRLNFTM